MEEAPFARLAGRLVTEKEASDRPFVFDAGGLLTPGGVARFAAEHMPMELAFTLDALGYRALAFGSAELAAPRRPMLRALGAIRGRGVPTVATNLFCDRPARALCEALVDGADGISLHRVGDRRLAFVAFLPEDAASRVAPDRAEGIRIAPVAPALADAVRRAREAGADVVVASVDPGSAGAVGLLELAEALPLADRPDVIFSGASGENLLFARPMGFRPAVIGAPPTGAVRVRLRDNPLTDGYDVLARVVPPSRRPSSTYEPFVAELGERFCAEWGRTLRGAALERPVDGTGMLELTAGAMRERADAEVAILNRGILDARWQPAREGALTASDVYVALQYDEPLMVAEVEGEWLEELAERAGDEGLVVPGLTEEGGDLFVNGRPLERRARYRLVTIRFLAAGGDDALPEGAEWSALEGATVRSVLLRYLERERDEDPRDALPRPESWLAWTVRATADASFSGSVVFNDADDGAGYESIPQSNSALTFGIDTKIRADALSRLLAWENEGLLVYRTTRITGGDLVEGEDRVQARSTALYRGFRDERPRFYVPEPFVEGWLSSELTVPEEIRAFRHLLVRPTAGLRFLLTQHLRLKLSGGFEHEVLDPHGDIASGGGANLTLEPFALLDEGGRRLTLSLVADYFVTSGSHTLRVDLDAIMDLAGPLQLVLGFDLTARDDFAEDRTPGVGASGSAALRLSWIGRVAP